MRSLRVAPHSFIESIDSPPGSDPSRDRTETLVVGTYREMPGLALDLRQATRLFGLSDSTCRLVLDGLVQDGRLRRRLDGRYTAS
jgi:hypothetical protein